MSKHAIEKALWKIGSSPVEMQEYLAEPMQYLANFQLSNDEKEIIKTLDVRAMADKGVNTVLMVNTYTALCGGPASLGEYLQKIAMPVRGAY